MGSRRRQPTCEGTKVVTLSDAHMILHAVSLGVLPMMHSRLSPQEKTKMKPGDVFVWEDGSTSNVPGAGMTRWTDAFSWSESRFKYPFLFYEQVFKAATSREPLIKQTYTALLRAKGRVRKWHITTYYTQSTFSSLKEVGSLPEISSLKVPEGVYECASKKKPAAERPYSSRTDRRRAIDETLSERMPQYAPFVADAGQTRQVKDPAVDPLLLFPVYADKSLRQDAKVVRRVRNVLRNSSAEPPPSLPKASATAFPPHAPSQSLAVPRTDVANFVPPEKWAKPCSSSEYAKSALSSRGAHASFSTAFPPHPTPPTFSVPGGSNPNFVSPDSRDAASIDGLGPPESRRRPQIGLTQPQQQHQQQQQQQQPPPHAYYSKNNNNNRYESTQEVRTPTLPGIGSFISQQDAYDDGVRAHCGSGPSFAIGSRTRFSAEEEAVVVQSDESAFPKYVGGRRLRQDIEPHLGTRHRSSAPSGSVSGTSSGLRLSSLGGSSAHPPPPPFSIPKPEEKRLVPRESLENIRGRRLAEGRESVDCFKIASSLF